MANYNTVITNEGAALLASVIANHGTITFTNLKLSENDYTGQEATLTEGTFDGIFANVSVASSIVDITTIKVSATVHGYNFSGDHNLYALGVIGTDGNTTALIAICTTTNPDVLRDNASTYAFNINLTVSSTSNITVVGTTAAALYTTDIVDTLISTATDKPLSANMGKKLSDEKQDKTLATPITVDGTQETTVEGALGSLNTYSDKIKDNLTGRNLLDNPWFTVNQRGFTSHTMDTTYFPTVDRWIGISSDYGGVVTLGASGINFNKEGYASPFYLTQKMDGLAVGKTYTLSVLFSDGTIEHGTGIINSTSDKVDFEFSNSRGKAHTYYYAAWSQWHTDIIAYAGSNFTVRAIKLELGSVSTLHLDVAPDYTTELLKCQRYFKVALNDTWNVGIGIAMATDTIEFYYFSDIPMRVAPSVSTAGSITAVKIADGSEVAISSVEASFDIDAKNGRINFKTSTTLTIRDLYILRMNNAKVMLSADL